jgi:hypothetical protein
MTRQTDITFPWADGKPYRFDLGPIAALEDLDGATDAGPEELLRRFLILDDDSGGVVESIRRGLLGPRAQDPYHIHRAALIGGGMKPAEASALCEKWVSRRPRAENYQSARAILMAVVIGVENEEDPVGKLPAGEDAAIPAAN